MYEGDLAKFARKLINTNNTLTIRFSADWSNDRKLSICQSCSFIASYLVDGSFGGKMVSTGSSNSWLINWNNSSVGEGLETIIWGISSSIDSWSSIGIDSSVQSLGGKVISSGSSNSWLINWDNSSIGVGNKLGVEVQGTSIAIVVSSNGWSGNNWGSDSWGSNSWGGNSWGSNSISSWSISISLSLDSKMVSSGSSNSWFINWDNSTIGVSNELSVEVEGTSIAIRWSISVARVGNSRSSSCSITIRNWSSSIRDWSSGIRNWGSSI